MEEQIGAKKLTGYSCPKILSISREPAVILEPFSERKYKATNRR